MRNSQPLKKYFQVELLLPVKYLLCRPPCAVVDSLCGVPKANLNRGKMFPKTSLK